MRNRDQGLLGISFPFSALSRWKCWSLVHKHIRSAEQHWVWEGNTFPVWPLQILVIPWTGWDADTSISYQIFLWVICMNSCAWISDTKKTTKAKLWENLTFWKQVNFTEQKLRIKDLYFYFSWIPGWSPETYTNNGKKHLDGWLQMFLANGLNIYYKLKGTESW